MADTIDALLTRALEAYAALTSLGEDVDDEWSYVQDLSSAWRERVETAAARHGDAPVSPAQTVAVERLIDEVGLIRDPHRAIDWLSTFPQVLLIAVGERP